MENSTSKYENKKEESKTMASKEENPSAANNNDSSTSTTTTTTVVVAVGDGVGDESNTDFITNNNHHENNRSINQSSTRTPFTDLSQIDADLALARTLQEQERAYMMLRMNGDGSDYGSWEAGSYMHDDDFDNPSEEEEFDGTDVGDDVNGDDDTGEDDGDDNEEDVFDVHAHAESGDGDNNNPGVELDPSAFPSDEAYARALQDAEDREMAARLLALAGLNEMVAGEDDDTEDHGGNSQDTWEDVDPDELSYEELLALGEVVGTESRGLSANTIASLPSKNYESQCTQDGNSDFCVICRVDYEDGDTLTVLCCKHSYHSECINNWLQINKVCPVCSAEVCVPENS